MNSVTGWLSRSRKAIAALVGASLTWGAMVVASPSGPVTATEWLALGVAVATALGVYGTVNEPPSTMQGP